MDYTHITKKQMAEMIEDLKRNHQDEKKEIISIHKNKENLYSRGVKEKDEKIQQLRNEIDSIHGDNEETIKRLQSEVHFHQSQTETILNDAKAEIGRWRNQVGEFAELLDLERNKSNIYYEKYKAVFIQPAPKGEEIQ